ncbi:MAG: hypothetical protein IPL55_08565 [Saprospiraceae bacterium]|nr:hypothetical protein [Saprospiraceae bacterium]MBL0027255.1 hypothetical protein [Saprospiraceae bacterium]
MELIYLIKNFPDRLLRIVRHLGFPFYKIKTQPCPSESLSEWFSDLLFYLLDIFGLPEIHQSLNRLFKWNTRLLTKEEEELGKSIFGDSVDFLRVRIDDKAVMGTKKMALAYVSFNTINYRYKIKPEIFIHEMVHIWQYQRFGSIYIGRAIKAQKSKEGYDYGGVANLYKTMLRGGTLLNFNFEQQADIIEDYYKVLKNTSSHGPMIINIYSYFAEDLSQINNAE